MKKLGEKTGDTVNAVPVAPTDGRRADFDEKVPLGNIARTLNATVEEVLEAREKSISLSLEETKQVTTQPMVELI